MSRIPTPNPPDPRAFLAFVFALGLVSAAALGGVFGPGVERAAEQSSPVGESEALVPAVVVGVAAAGALASGGLALADMYLSENGTDGVTENDLQKILSTETKEQKLDLHAGLVSQTETAETYRTMLDNFVSDSQSVAAMKAKARMVEILNSGNTNATYIEQEMDEEIAEYYSVRQRNLIARYNQHAAQLEYALRTANNDSQMNVENVVIGVNTHSEYYHQSWDWSGEGLVRGEPVTLANGTVVNATAFQTTQSDGSVSETVWVWLNGHTASYNWRAINYANVTGVSDSSWDSDKNVSESFAMEWNEYESTWNQLQSEESDLASDYDQAFADSVATSYEQGTINTTDLVTPEMLASEWTTSYNDTQSSLYKWSTLAALGLDAPNLSETSHLTLDYEKPMPVRYVTVNATGAPEVSEITLTVNASDDQYDRTVTLSNGTETFKERLPIPEGATATLEGGTQNTSLTVDSGGTQTFAGAQITTENVDKFDRVEERGMLFARDAPDTGFVVGTTYDADNRTLFFTPAGANSSIIRLGGNVTITAAEDRDGNSLNAVEVESYNYQTTSSDDLEAALTQLGELRTLTESREPLIGGGGGGGGGLGGGGSPYVLAAILALVVAAMLRDGGS